MIITIDGPVASGKSTVAQLLAKKLGFYYLYTGFLYRGIAYVLVKHYGYDETSLPQLKPEDVDTIVHKQDFEYRYEQGKPKIIYNGVDISAELKSKDVDNWSSLISALPFVRHAVFEYQVRIGQKYDVVAEGRDMATVVFPQAQYKFFLTASDDVRAKRWQSMQAKRGEQYSYEESLKTIRERDQRDASRAHSPLMQAPDATLIDNSSMDIDQTVQAIEGYIKNA
jgi:cytidylate kinase